MAVIHIAGLITLILFGAVFVILGLVTASTSWTSTSPEMVVGLNEQTVHGLLVAVLGFALIGAGLYVAKRSKN